MSHRGFESWLNVRKTQYNTTETVIGNVAVWTLMFLCCYHACLDTPMVRNILYLTLTPNLHFLACVLRVLFPSRSPIWLFNFCCSCTLRTPFDLTEELEEEESAFRHSFWDCRQAVSLATSPQPCTSAWWWVRQKRFEQNSHSRPMSEVLVLHLMN